MAVDMKSVMPNVYRHLGKWSGVYTHTTPANETIDSYHVDCDVSFPADGVTDFRLQTRNVWPDGRQTQGRYDAVFRDGALWFDDDLIGKMWEIDDFTTFLRFSFRHDRTIDVCEMLQISKDGQHRARTWHWFRDEKIFQITRTQEWRAG